MKKVEIWLNHSQMTALIKKAEKERKTVYAYVKEKVLASLT